MTEKVTEGGATFILEPIVNQDGKKNKKVGLVLVSPAVFWFFVWGFFCNNCLFQIHHHISISMFFFFLKLNFFTLLCRPLVDLLECLGSLSC